MSAHTLLVVGQFTKFGKVKLYNTSKDELIELWNKVISEHDLEIVENTKVDQIIPFENDTFKIITNTGHEYISNQVLMSIGRRGTPRKLGIPGEELPKVAYRLLEPERIADKKIVVVGGGDSAIESALLLKDNNDVILSYRKDQFARLKPKNKEKILEAAIDNSIDVQFNTNLISLEENNVLIKGTNNDVTKQVENDLVYIFAGGELPTKFLQNAGIEISKRFGHVMKKHK